MQTTHQIFENLEARKLMAASVTGGTLLVVGTESADVITVAVSGSDHVVTINGTPSSFPSAGVERIKVFSLDGEDRVEVNVATPSTVSGGNGNDTIFGGTGIDVLGGDAGNDLIDGNPGDDKAFLGTGDDTFVWDPGDNSDRVEGASGADTLRFNGAAAAEEFTVSANGNRMRFFRNLGNVTIDTNDTETLDLRTLGGADNVAVNNLAGTDVTQVRLELESAFDSGTGDAAADAITINGSSGSDQVTVTGDANGINVTGLAAAVSITNSEGANDSLTVKGWGSKDLLDAAALEAGFTQLTLDGGWGNDTIRGSRGNDDLLGAGDNDYIDGNPGADTADLGAGNDTFVWDPGDGSDVADGQAGKDTLLFNGAAADETFDASNNAGRLRFFRNVGNITIDGGTLELVDVRALGGNDTVTVNSLAGTGVGQVVADGGDGNDTLTGSAGKETFFGGTGSDNLDGGDGNDYLDPATNEADDNTSDNVEGGGGNDRAVAGDGDNYDLGAGIDELIFRGTESADQIIVKRLEFPGDTRVQFATNSGLTEAQLFNAEVIGVTAGGGNDTVKISSYAGKLWRARFFGGNGHDKLFGGALADTLRGEAGNDSLFGLGSTDDLDGGPGSNVVIQ